MDDETWDKYSHYISKSRISTFKFCPMQYKKRYVDGIKDDKPNYSLTVGSRFHNFAETFFDIAYDYETDAWPDFIHEDFSLYEREMLEWFIEQETDRLKLMNNDRDLWMPKVREEKFLNHKLQLRGIIDRIDHLGDTNVIVEYKTSKSIYKPGLQLEFGFYKLLLSEMPQYKDKKLIGCVVNPRLKEIQFMSPSREETVMKIINDLRTSIDTGEFERTCTGVKISVCKLCTLDECGLYNF